MARCVGIAVYGDRVEAAELSGSPSDFRVTKWGRAPVTGNGANGPRTEALAGLFRDMGLPRDPIIAGMPSGTAIIRSMSVPFQKPEHIRKVLKTQASEHIHGHSIDNVVLSFHKVADSKDGARIILLGVARETVASFLDVCGKAGADPQVVGLDLLALFNLGTASGAFGKGKTAVIINAEPGSCGFVISKDGELAMARPIRTALDGFSLPAAGIQAASSPAGSGSGPSPDAQGQRPDPSIIESSAAAISREIKRSMLAASLGAEGAAFHVSGFLSADRDFTDAISRGIGAPVAPLDMLEIGPGRKLSDCSPDFRPFPAVVAGLALKGLGGDLDLADFRSGEFAFHRKFDQVRFGLCVAAALAFGLFCALGFYFDMKVKAARDEHKKIAQEAVDLCTRVIPLKELPQVTRTNAVPAIKKLISTRLEELVGKGAEKDVPQINSALSWWNELSRRIESAQGVKHLSIERIMVTQNSFGISGETDSPTSIDSMINRLKTFPAFSKADTYSPPKKTEEGRYTFDIRGDVQGGQ